MRVRGLDANGDWQFGRGLQNYKVGNDGITQNVVTRCREWYGDCFFNVTAGIDYVNLLGSKYSQDDLEFAIRSVILDTYGVKSIESFELVLDNLTRVLKIDCFITTIFSNSAIPVEIILSING